MFPFGRDAPSWAPGPQTTHTLEVPLSRKLLFAVAWLAPLCAALSPQPARALDTGRTYSVYFDGDKAGSWTLRKSVSETSTSCRYTVRWSNLAGTRTRSCQIDERKAGDHFDCQLNRTRGVSTYVRKTSGVTCGAFDDAGQSTTVSSLSAGESSGSTLSGVITVASLGDVQSFSAR